ncbi:hypothetical protein MMC07_004849 [Pseudocyphellaria aurata]|nr:hypothetical protein [Pseudocyphellaria aurata]
MNYVEENIDGALRMSSDLGQPRQDCGFTLSKSSDNRRAGNDRDKFSELSDNEHAKHDRDNLLSKSSEHEHIMQFFDGSSTKEIRTATKPNWQEEIYDALECILKEVSLGLNSIPLGLLRYEYISRWNFDNPSRDARARPELLLQQEDLSEEHRANRIIDWLDKRFPWISNRKERNGPDLSRDNVRLLYTEADFSQWLVEEDKISQGSHPRGGFVKKGGDWKCKTCIYQGLQVWFDRMIAFCPLCKQPSGPYENNQVSWIEGALTDSVHDEST